MSYYKLLGVDKDATPEEIKRQFKRQAQKHHPDKGGDDRYMAEITQAYECLSDPDRRQHYDAYGEEKSLNSIEHQAMQVIYNIILQLSEKAGEDLDFVLNINLNLRNNLRDLEKKQPQLELQIRRTEAQRKRIKHRKKGETNRLDFVFQQKIDALKAKLAELPEAIEIGSKALEIMKDYENDYIEARELYGLYYR